MLEVLIIMIFLFMDLKRFDEFSGANPEADPGVDE